MMRSRPRPRNMDEICRLCLTEDGITSPIFGDDDSSEDLQIPLSFRIMACVSVEVSLSDGLPTLICQRCLTHVNTWHEFKELCDTSQATLKEWQDAARDEEECAEVEEIEKDSPEEIEINSPEGIQKDTLEEREKDTSEEIEKENRGAIEIDAEAGAAEAEVSTLREKDGESAISSSHDIMTDKNEIIIKQEPVDDIEIVEEEEDIQSITETEQESYMVDYIKQEEIDVHEGTHILCDEMGDPLGIAVDGTGTVVHRDGFEAAISEVEMVTPEVNGLSGLRISDIKTEREEIIDVDDDDSNPAEGRLLRSVLQGKTKITMYSKKVFDAAVQNYNGKPFTCGVCDKSFSYNYLLKRHEKIHAGERNICVHCDQGFSSTALLAQHVRHYEGTSSRPYSCDECLQEFPCQTEFLTHMDSREDGQCPLVAATQRQNPKREVDMENLFQCYICFSTFATQLQLRFHMRKDHQHYSCHMCNKIFSNGVALSNHLRGHCTGGQRRQCDKCPKSFPSMNLLLRHKRSHTKARAPIAPVAPMAVIPVKNDGREERGSTKGTVKQEPTSPLPESDHMEHMPKHIPETGGVSYPCSVCKEMFSSQAALRFHLKGVHMQYHCHRCTKVYTSGVALSNHLRSHNLDGIKRHRCMTCLKTFPTLDILTKHRKTHKAPEPTMSTRQMANSKLQEATSQEDDVEATQPEDDRTCGMCQLVTSSPAALERHMACHSKDTSYSCPVCELSVTYASSLQKHMRLIHGLLVDMKDIQSDQEKMENQEIDIQDDVDTVNREEEEEEEEEELMGEPEMKFFDQDGTVEKKPEGGEELPYECKTCSRTFAYKSFLLRHLKIHKLKCANMPATCPICYKTFADPKTLNNHKGVHTRFKHYACQVCGKSFNGMNAWQKHQRMHQKGFIYSCKLCGKKFISKADLHEHKKMHIKLKIYTCAICKNSYHSSSALSKHKRKNGHWYSSEADVESPDLISDDSMTDVEVIPAEMLEVPLEVMQSEAEAEAETAAELQPQPQQSEQPGNYSTGKKRPYCNICHRTFTRMATLRKHKRLHLRGVFKPVPVAAVETKEGTGEELADNQCPVCYRSFPDPASLVRHKGWHTRRHEVAMSPPPTSTSAPAPALVHMGVSPDMDISPSALVKVELNTPKTYTCPHCQKNFSTGSALANHVKVHVGNNQKSHFCPKCNKSFTTNSALANHVKVHIHYCSKCDRNFSTSSALANHMKVHVEKDPQAVEPAKDNTVQVDPSVESPQRRMACKICRKPFETKKALITHIGWHSRTSYSKKSMINPYVPKVVVEVQPVQEVQENFKCNVCNKTFSSAFMLSKHKKLHTRHLLSSIKVKSDGGSTPARLPTAYHRSGSLWKHKRTQHAFKLFSCPVCQKRFGIKWQLMKHMETHDIADEYMTPAQNIYSCGFCSKSFGRLDRLRQHEKSHQA